MWNGHSESFAVLRKGTKASLPSSSYISAPDVGTDTPGHPSAIKTHSHSKPAQLAWLLRSAPSRVTGSWTSWQAFNVRDFASAAQAGAANLNHPPNSPCSISSNSNPLLALPCFFSLTLLLPEQLRVLATGIRRQVATGCGTKRKTGGAAV